MIVMHLFYFYSFPLKKSGRANHYGLIIVDWCWIHDVKKLKPLFLLEFRYVLSIVACCRRMLVILFFFFRTLLRPRSIWNKKELIFLLTDVSDVTEMVW